MYSNLQRRVLDHLIVVTFLELELGLYTFLEFEKDRYSYTMTGLWSHIYIRGNYISEFSCACF
jgi:hypothetical protein